MTDQGTEEYVVHRELLFAIVYSMLGSVADTEDVLQETWLSWSAAQRDRIDNPRSYLVRIAVNQALSRRTARETSPTALLVVLETLSPAERAVFVLREAFGHPYADIAEMLGRSPEAIRQLAHQAREHVSARRPRYRGNARVQRQATERFIDATLGGDLEALLDVLAPDVTLWTDGDAPATNLQPVLGRDAVAHLLVAIGTHMSAGPMVAYRHINGDPSAVLFGEDSPFAVLVLDYDGPRINAIHSITNPL